MNVYAMKYLNFSEIHLQFQENYGVFGNEWRILRFITKTYICDNTPLRVQNLIVKSEIASPATIHRIMKTLISKDLVKLVTDECDGRVKYIEPTSLAIKLFNEIGRRMK